MARGPKKHLKRMFAPHHWMLQKLKGEFSVRPSQGPHKLRECVPLTVLLKNKLKYALTTNECIKICRNKEGLVRVDNKVRRDHKYPTGFMDVITIPRTGESFRMLIDTKGRFVPHKISGKEVTFKLCKIKNRAIGPNKVPYLTTHDGRTIRYAHPEIKKNDTIKVSIFIFNNYSSISRLEKSTNS